MFNLTGKTLDRYRLQAVIGEGGMGAVYQAYDLTLQRTVAIKVMHPQFAHRRDFQDRFLQEARSAARLDHPGIVNVYDFGQAEDYLYIVMEYLPGKNLKDALAELRATRRWLPLLEAVRLVRQVAIAVDYANQHGVFHRDLKPGNLVLVPLRATGGGLGYRPVVTDLGLSHLAEGGVVTQTGLSMGTPAYMSPEHARGQKTDARSEIYSLGVLLYELGTGRLPFPAQTVAEAVFYHTQEAPPALTELRPNLPEPYAVVVDKALAKDPAQRFERAAGLARALDAIEPAVRAGDPESIAPAGDVGLAELLTDIDTTPVVPPPVETSQPVTQVIEETQARVPALEVIGPGGVERVFPLTARVVSIGRDPRNDLTLDLPSISRRHARLERADSGFRLTDLDSANGAFLEGERLLPGVPTPIAPGQTFRLGKQTLRLVSAAADLAGTQTAVLDPNETRPSPHQAATQVALRRTPPAAPPPAVQTEDVSVYMEPMQLAVRPGETVTAAIAVANRGAEEDSFRIQLDGLPTTWYTLTPRLVRLRPGAQAQVSLQIRPPHNSTSRAGRYPFRLRVAGQAQPMQAVELKPLLTIAPYYDFSGELNPIRIPTGQRAQVIVHNQGNIQETYTLQFHSPDGDLTFHPARAQLRIPEGQSAVADYNIETRRIAWFGTPKARPFDVSINAGSGKTQELRGEAASRPLLPLWLLPALAVVCLCLASAFFVYYNRVGSPQARARATAAAQSTALAFAESATLNAQTATQQSAEQAITGTLQALTATAAWISGDPDQDGLSTAREAELGTDPQVADTDADGLSDGEEVTRNTNPLLPDTDGDTLLDGVEVNRGTNPLSPDSDADGTPDAFDTAPNASSTPRPSATPTITPTPSNTPPPTLTFTPSVTPSPTTPPTASNTPTVTTAPTTPAPVINGLAAGVQPAAYTGPCPADFTLSGSISVSGPATVVYHWQRSDGSTTPDQSLTFNSGGAQNVSTVWNLDQSGAYWAQLVILQPQQVASPQANFTVNCQAPNTVVQFAELPGGVPITADLLLSGNEFTSQGVVFSAEPQPVACPSGVAVAVRPAGTAGVPANFLTSAQPGDATLCNTAPLTITFTTPVQAVTLTFAGSAQVYTLEAFDAAGDSLGVAQKNGLPGGGAQITIQASSANISRITFGRPGSLTAITSIDYTK